MAVPVIMAALGRGLRRPMPNSPRPGWRLSDWRVGCEAADGSTPRTIVRARHHEPSAVRSRGQSLTEFALVAPVMLLILMAIIQFSLIFWAQNTLTQVVRDTGRWAATQQTRPCDGAGAHVVAKANELAVTEVLFGYTSGQWSGSGYTYGASPVPPEGVELGWPVPTSPPSLGSGDCPPSSNQIAWFINIRAHHEVPLFFPLIGNFIPACDADSCTLSSAVQFRMEPAP